MTCPNCFHSQPFGSGTCSHCGSPLAGNTVPSADTPSFTFHGAQKGYAQLVSVNPRTLHGKVTLPKNKSKENWRKRLLIKCIISTSVTLMVAALVMFVNFWPGCLVSAALLVFAVAMTVLTIAFQSDKVIGYCDPGLSDERLEYICNSVLNLLLIFCLRVQDL